MRTTLTPIAAALILLAACGHKNPGMSKEEAAEALVANALMARETAKEQAFADDYRPEPGIKYKAKTLDTPPIELNVPKALKDKRPLTPAMLTEWKELNTDLLPDTLRSGNIIPIGPKSYLANAFRGIYLLDENLAVVRELFRNEDNRKLLDVYYDLPLGQLRCRYYWQSDDYRTTKLYVATLPLQRLLDSPAVWTPDSLKSKLPVERKNLNWLAGACFAGIPGGYALTVAYTNTFYTHDAKGDTLCRFTPMGESTNLRTGSPRPGERTKAFYLYDANGKPTSTRLLLAYDNHIYTLMSPETAKEYNVGAADESVICCLYRLDFGTLKRPTPGSMKGDQSDKFFISRVRETKNYLFVDLGKSERGRDYCLAYDKTKDVFFAYDNPILP
ncbi:MAG: DUF4933 domain-containing protein [Mediterranea sp.]|jgi:hypothetical protein|nr:DUF4933 domain-containing protein [Mediterranea sp.]